MNDGQLWYFLEPSLEHWVFPQQRAEPYLFRHIRTSIHHWMDLVMRKAISPTNAQITAPIAMIASILLPVRWVPPLALSPRKVPLRIVIRQFYCHNNRPIMCGDDLPRLKWKAFNIRRVSPCRDSILEADGEFLRIFDNRNHDGSIRISPGQLLNHFSYGHDSIHSFPFVVDLIDVIIISSMVPLVNIWENLCSNWSTI